MSITPRSEPIFSSSSIVSTLPAYLPLLSAPGSNLCVDRLVDCQALRKAFDAFYSTLLPKGGHPFVYLDLQIDPQKLDVNVHPTKHEVVFEDEEEVVQLVVASLSSTLSAKATSRRFSSQAAAGATALASGVSSRENSAPLRLLPSFLCHLKFTSALGDTAAGSDSVKLAPHKTVRTDSRARTLDGMLGFAATQTQSGSKEAVPLRDDDMSNVASKPSSQKTASIQVTKCNLASVQQLRRGIENNVHHGEFIRPLSLPMYPLTPILRAPRNPEQSHFCRLSGPRQTRSSCAASDQALHGQLCPPRRRTFLPAWSETIRSIGQDHLRAYSRD